MSGGSGSSGSAFLSTPKPQIPSSKTSFEPPLKTILRRRVVTVFSLCAVVAFLGSALVNARMGGRWEVWIPLTLMKGGLWLVGGLAPPLVWRKISVQAYARSGVASSFRAHLKATLRDHQTILTCVMYTLSSLSFLIYSLPPVFSGRRRYPVAINPDMLFVISASVFVAVWQGLRESLRERKVVQWSKYTPASAIMEATQVMLPRNIRTAVLSSLVGLIVFIPLYFTVLHITLYILSYFPLQPFLYSLHRSLCYHVLPFPLSLAVSLPAALRQNVWGVVVIAFRNCFMWEISNTLTDVYFAKIPTQIGGDEKAVTSIVAGISSENDYFSQHAYNLLADLTKSSDSARKVIYNDLNHSPSMWTSVLRSTLGANGLGTSRGELLRQGAPPPAVKPPPPVTKPAAPIPGTPIKLQKQSIFKAASSSPTQRFLNEAFSSDGSAAKVVANATDGLSRLPSLFLAQSGEASKPQAVIKKAEAAVVQKVEATTQAVTGFEHRVLRLFSTPRWVKTSGLEEYWVGERRDRVARSWVRRRERDIKAIEVLQSLVEHSLSEDSLGTVQRDIPKVLEVLCTYLADVEEAREELLRGLKNGDSLQMREDVAKAVDVVEPLRRALSDAIDGIVRTFGASLSVFKFAPRTARRIQIVADQL